MDAISSSKLDVSISSIILISDVLRKIGKGPSFSNPRNAADSKQKHFSISSELSSSKWPERASPKFSNSGKTTIFPSSSLLTLSSNSKSLISSSFS